MTNNIEEIERKQQTYWRGFLAAFFLAIALLVVRYLFATKYADLNLNSHPIGFAVVGLAALALATDLFFVTKLGQLHSVIKGDPSLKEALLDDELSRLHIAESWKAGFFGAAVTPFVFLLINSFHPIDDLLLVAFSTTIVGSGAFLTARYLKSR